MVIALAVGWHSSSGRTSAATHPSVGQPTATVSTASPPPAPAAPPAPASPARPASCQPLSDEGTCYEPGEYCRDDNHGMTGVAGDGKTIECEDNDGWRWEPVE